MCAANAQQIDIVEQSAKMFVPFLILGAIIKIASLFIPSKRRHHRHRKAPDRTKTIRNQNLIPCQDCHGLISLRARVCPHCGAPIDANYIKEIKEKRNKARRTERDKKFLSKMAMSEFIGLFIIVCAIVTESNTSLLIWICIGLLLIALPAITTYASFNKGKMGELIVRTRLKKGLPAGEYDILNNIYLPIGKGATTQIDHIVVSRFGVFVVETKNYSGWIFADASSKVWMQTIYHAKNTFQNPIRQNYHHICSIATNLGLPQKYIHGVVAFTGDCEFKTPMPDGVVYSRKLADYIKSFTSAILKEKEKTEILVALREWDASVTPQQRASHIENLRQHHN